MLASEQVRLFTASKIVGNSERRAFSHIVSQGFRSPQQSMCFVVFLVLVLEQINKEVSVPKPWLSLTGLLAGSLLRVT